MFHDLRQVTYLKIVRNSYFTVCRALQSAYELQNGRLAGSVLTDKSNLVTLAYMKVYFIQQGEASVCNCQIVNRYHKPLYFNFLLLITTNKDTKFI